MRISITTPKNKNNSPFSMVGYSQNSYHSMNSFWSFVCLLWSATRKTSMENSFTFFGISVCAIVYSMHMGFLAIGEKNDWNHYEKVNGYSQSKTINYSICIIKKFVIKSRLNYDYNWWSCCCGETRTRGNNWSFLLLILYRTSLTYFIYVFHITFLFLYRIDRCALSVLYSNLPSHLNHQVISLYRSFLCFFWIIQTDFRIKNKPTIQLNWILEWRWISTSA